jgi:hypothetical protein
VASLVHGGLERVAGQFAIALCRVPVAHEQQRARMVDTSRNVRHSPHGECTALMIKLIYSDYKPPTMCGEYPDLVSNHWGQTHESD